MGLVESVTVTWAAGRQWAEGAGRRSDRRRSGGSRGSEVHRQVAVGEGQAVGAGRGTWQPNSSHISTLWFI